MLKINEHITFSDYNVNTHNKDIISPSYVSLLHLD